MSLLNATVLGSSSPCAAWKKMETLFFLLLPSLYWVMPLVRSRDGRLPQKSHKWAYFEEPSTLPSQASAAQLQQDLSIKIKYEHRNRKIFKKFPVCGSKDITPQYGVIQYYRPLDNNWSVFPGLKTRWYPSMMKVTPILVIYMYSPLPWILEGQFNSLTWKKISCPNSRYNPCNFLLISIFLKSFQISGSSLIHFLLEHILCTKHLEKHF